MDIWTENQLLAEYHFWAEEALLNSSEKQDPGGASFFSNLDLELGKDVKDVWEANSVSKENGWYEFVNEEDHSCPLKTERVEAARWVEMGIDQIWRPWDYGVWKTLLGDTDWENSEDSEEDEHFKDAESTASISVKYLTSATIQFNGSPTVLLGLQPRLKNFHLDLSTSQQLTHYLISLRSKPEDSELD